MIGKLLGHRKVQTTARHAHLARGYMKATAERVADRLAADLETAPGILAVIWSTPSSPGTSAGNVSRVLWIIHHFVLGNENLRWKNGNHDLT